ncbi:MAG: trypsin-like peptidase domain-containing protein [Magnetococcales bacterium]|nr:trypsin-like peptidase domain-containing protein [Magnetococcales bacterium]
MALKSTGSDKFCGKEYHKYLYLIVVIAIGIMIGGYWYSGYNGVTRGERVAAQVANVPQGAPFPGQPQAVPAAMPMPSQGPVDFPTPDTGHLNRPGGFAAVVRSMMPSVVNISAHSESSPRVQPAQGDQANSPVNGPELPRAVQAPAPGSLQFADPFSGVSQESIGSGIIVTTEGHVLTNFHVVENAKNVVVLVYNGAGDKSFFAEVVARDNTRDLALLLIESADIQLKPAALGNSENAQIGDSVITIGSPYGLNHSVSKGIVSGKRKVVNIGGVLHKGLLQTDAAINRGNSGGPLVDGQGWVIGVNTAIYTTTSAFSGVGFAVPINAARDFLEDWITLPGVRPDLPMPGQAAGAHIAVRPPPPIQANAQPPHGDRGPCANCHDILPGPQPVALTRPSVAAPRNPGPPIRADATMPHEDWGPCTNCHQILPATQPIAFGVGPGPGLHRPAGQMGLRGAGLAADEGNFDAMQQFSFTPGGAIGVTVAGVPDAPAVAGDSGIGIVWNLLDATSAERLRVPVPFGAAVNSVTPGLPGESLGLKVDDVILKADGRWLRTVEQVQEVFDRVQRGEVLRLLVYRDGVRMELNTANMNVGGQAPSATWLPVAGQMPMTQPVMVPPGVPEPMVTMRPSMAMPPQPVPGGENGMNPGGMANQGSFGNPVPDAPAFPGQPLRQTAPAAPTEFEWMGMEMVPMDQAAWQRNPDLTGKWGGLVTDIDPGAQAQRAGIKKGDLVVAINGVPVLSAQALDQAIKSVKSQTGVLVEIERMKQRMFATLQ